MKDAISSLVHRLLGPVAAHATDEQTVEFQEYKQAMDRMIRAQVRRKFIQMKWDLRKAERRARVPAGHDQPDWV
jgi:hypothetical protein